MSEWERWIYCGATIIAGLFIWYALVDLIDERSIPQGCALICDIDSYHLIHGDAPYSEPQEIMQ